MSALLYRDGVGAESGSGLRRGADEERLMKGVLVTAAAAAWEESAQPHLLV